jgi:hypothetical protein
MSKKKPRKERLEGAIWELLDEARSRGVSIEFKDPDTCAEVWPDCAGYFDPMFSHIVCYKKKESPLNIHHVFTLAHELRHAYQYHSKMCSALWLANIGIYPTFGDAEAEAVIEADADQAAESFMSKHGLPVPPSPFEKEHL